MAPTILFIAAAPKCDVRFTHDSNGRIEEGNLCASVGACLKNCHLYGGCRYPCENLRIRVWPGVDFVRSPTDTTSPETRVSGAVGLSHSSFAMHRLFKNRTLSSESPPVSAKDGSRKTTYVHGSIR
jgi:hypothetical protein